MKDRMHVIDNMSLEIKHDLYECPLLIPMFGYMGLCDHVRHVYILFNII